MFSLFGDFHKRNKERTVAAKERASCRSYHRCVCEGGEEEAPREGPSGQGEGSPQKLPAGALAVKGEWRKDAVTDEIT